MLENYRVIELGVWVAGPAAAGVLADWGADVVKVESPEGDPMRRMLQVIVGHGEPQSPPFDLDNRGKRSVVLDLKDEADRHQLHEMIADADVFLTNLRADALERLGFGPDQLLAENPRLVYALVTGYGLEGPDAQRAGYDVGGFWARTGIAAALAPEGQPPPNIRGGFGDHVTALATCRASSARCSSANAPGKGQLVETSLLRTGVYCLGWDLGMQMRFERLGSTRPRTEEINPLVNCYQAGDGKWFWLLGVESQRHWPNLCRSIGRPDLIDDERFVDARGRRHNAKACIEAFDAEFERRTRDELTAAFDEHDVWWAPVLTPAEVVDDPQAIAAGCFVDVPEGEGAAAHRGVASPVKFHAGDTATRTSARSRRLMRFTVDSHERIANGEITCTYRAWKRPQVKVGGRYHVGPVDLVVDSVDQVQLGEVSDRNARRSGFADRDALASFLQKHVSVADDDRVWHVEFHTVEREDPPSLGDRADLTDADIADICARLDRMDARSESGPWTRATLELIGDNPGVVSTELAARLGRDRAPFKVDVRKLKRLGLTISLEVGYRLSPRGETFLRR